MMVDKIKAQNETFTSQKFTNLQIVGDLVDYVGLKIGGVYCMRKMFH